LFWTPAPLFAKSGAGVLFAADAAGGDAGQNPAEKRGCSHASVTGLPNLKTTLAPPLDETVSDYDRRYYLWRFKMSERKQPEQSVSAPLSRRCNEPFYPQSLDAARLAEKVLRVALAEMRIQAQ